MKNRKTPMRRCAGCMESKPKGELVRIAYYEGKLSVDPTGKAKGRGVYLCHNRECMETAKKRHSLQRSFNADIAPEELEKVFLELSEYKKESD